jgi:maltokinase
MSTAADIAEAITSWMLEQRWYQLPGATPQFDLVGWLEWPASAPTWPGEAHHLVAAGEQTGAAREHTGAAETDRVTPDSAGILRPAPQDTIVATAFIRDSAGRRPTLYQVPVTVRSAPAADLEHALIGAVVIDGGERWVYDGPHDPLYAQALYRLIISGARVQSETTSATGHPTRIRSRARVVRSHVLSGEQSNTSIIFELSEDERPIDGVILKVFRTLGEGDNPDIVVQSALTAAGSELVPTVIGYVSGRWPGSTGSTVPGHLAFAQTFLAGVEDAWRVALRSVADGEDFAEQARTLGIATATVHTQLADVFGTVTASDQEVAGVIGRMRRRLALAVSDIPQLGGHAAAIDSLICRVERVPWPAFQRIHGDYHLGQVVAVPGRGWVLLDFEGEPLRPLSERSRPDSTFRDIAGMLRSFDYAAGASTSHDAARWAHSARTAFLDGYSGESGVDLSTDRSQLLLAACELDKALYEAIYEARNRPRWLPIPLNAIDRLVRG